MRIQFSARTDVGKVRKENQDSFGVLEAKNFYAVCDGMGGGAAGDFASRCAADIVVKALEILSAGNVESIIGKLPFPLSDEYQRPIAAIRLANRALHNFTLKYPKLAGMGTTLVAVSVDMPNHCIHIYHVGDSRVYRVRDGVIALLTKDHSKVNELIDQGKMTEAEVKTAEIQSMITRALGTNAKVRIDYQCVELLVDDYFVLCSDGLNGEIDDRTIRNVIVKNRGKVDAIAAELIARANAAGGRDNTTAIAIRVIDESGNMMSDGVVPVRGVATVGEETDEQLALEDKVLKSLLTQTLVKVPKSARERNLFNNPIVLGAVMAVLVSVVAFVPKRVIKTQPDTKLSDLTGKVSGIALDIRVPTPEQLAVFSKAEDNIQRLEIIQDWQRSKDSMTLPLENVVVTITENGKEQFNGMSAAKPVKIILPQGACVIKAHYKNYKMVSGDRMELRDTVTIPVEIGTTLQSVVLIMIPAS
jgi:protein phosphatase